MYLHAAKSVNLPASRVALVAVHAWDILGAHQAGLVTGWVSRREKLWHPAMPTPDVQGKTLVEVARGLLKLPAAKESK